MAIKPVSVSQLNSYIKRQLALDPILANVPVSGEISGLTKHSTGHWYFSLKDEKSKINCFLARDRVRMLRYDLSDGLKITAWGNVSVYERGGYYSLNIRDVEVEGEGDLAKAFENLKNKLDSEGLFDSSHKKPIPKYPRKIGVVTSPTGATIRDIITTVKRRSPFVDVLLYPCIVQGPDAAASICEGIKVLNSFDNIDLLIVGRGGGSLEDLWAFNEESVARAVYASEIPVISAVGHEVDYVISDFTADLRAATPTAAAELAVPHIEEFKDRLRNCSPMRMFGQLQHMIDSAEAKAKHLMDMSDAYVDSKFSDAAHRLQLLKLDIDSYNPMNQLEKGYAIAKSQDGSWISSINDTKTGDEIYIILKDGSLKCLIEENYR